MCRLFIVYSPSTIITKAVTIALAKISYKLGNQHGYFAQIAKDICENSEIIRTLSEGKYFKFLASRSYKIAHCHLRLASIGKISLENVHGFEVKVNNKKYYVAMNGSFTNYTYYSSYTNYYSSITNNYVYRTYYETLKESEKSDTRILAELIDKYESVVRGIIEFLNEWHGWGTTFIVSEDFEDAYIWIHGHHCYIAEVKLFHPDGHAYILSSQKDIIEKLKEVKKVKVCEKRVEKRKIWFFELEDNVEAPIFESIIRVKKIKIATIPEGLWYINFRKQEYKHLVQS